MGEGETVRTAESLTAPRAIRRAKGRYFRGAKGDFDFRGGPNGNQGGCAGAPLVMVSDDMEMRWQRG